MACGHFSYITQLQNVDFTRFSLTLDVPPCKGKITLSVSLVQDMESEVGLNKASDVAVFSTRP